MSSEGSSSRVAPVTSDEFRRACGRFATGVTVAGILDEEGAPHGLTVSSFTSVSLDPPLILICLGHAVTMIEAFRRAKFFGISVLGVDQRDISDRFARKGFDRFEGVGWRRGANGAPLLNDSLAAIECAVRHRYVAGDHDILVGEMVAAQVSEGEPLIHFGSRYRTLAI